MNKAIQLQQTMQWMDLVPLTICLYIHRVCNDNQFVACSGSDFANFLNLKPTANPVVVRPKEKLRVCYLISAISATLPTKEIAKGWIAGMIKQCGFTTAYFNSHCSDVKSIVATDTNKEYCKMIDDALENAREL